MTKNVEVFKRKVIKLHQLITQYCNTSSTVLANAVQKAHGHHTPFMSILATHSLFRLFVFPLRSRQHGCGVGWCLTCTLLNHLKLKCILLGCSKNEDYQMQTHSLSPALRAPGSFCKQLCSGRAYSDTSGLLRSSDKDQCDFKGR